MCYPNPALEGRARFPARHSVANVWRKCSVVLLLSLGCVDERVDDICSRVQDCGGLDTRSFCESRLEDALSDGRTSAAQAAGCAVCISQKSNDCTALLVTRDCDTSCSNIDLVTNMYTSIADRRDACEASDELCRFPSDSTRVDACVAGLDAQIRDQPQLDKALGECASCLRSAVAATSGTSMTQTDSQDAAATATPACSSNTCATPCIDFQGLISALTAASQADLICQTVAVTCQAVSHFAGSRDACMTQLTKAGIPVRTIQACATCLGASASCAALFPQDMGAGGEGDLSSAEGCSDVCSKVPGLASPR